MYTGKYTQDENIRRRKEEWFIEGVKGVSRQCLWLRFSLPLLLFLIFFSDIFQ